MSGGAGWGGGEPREKRLLWSRPEMTEHPEPGRCSPGLSPGLPPETLLPRPPSTRSPSAKPGGVATSKGPGLWPFKKVLCPRQVGAVPPRCSLRCSGLEPSPGPPHPSGSGEAPHRLGPRGRGRPPPRPASRLHVVIQGERSRTSLVLGEPLRLENVC